MIARRTNRPGAGSAFRVLRAATIAMVLGLPGLAAADSQFGTNGLGVGSMISHARGWGMGGLSTALDDSLRVSFSNPALAAGQRQVSMAILYAADRRSAEDGGGDTRYNSSTFPYFAFLVPMGNRLGLGFGYNLEQDLGSALTNSGVISSGGDVPEHTRLFERSGSVFRVPGVVALRPHDNLYLGFRVDAFFANSEERFELDFVESGIETTEERVEISGRGTGGGFGVAWKLPPHLSVGFSYATSVTMNASRRRIGMNGSVASRDIDIGFPERLSAGATLRWSRFTLGGEVTQARWEDLDDTEQLAPLGGYQDVTEWGVGFEFAEDRFGPLLGRFPWRVGFRSSPLSYVTLDGETIDHYSFTFGSGFNLGRGGFCDLALEYGLLGDASTVGLEENYYRFVVGFSGQEPWRKRKSYID